MEGMTQVFEYVPGGNSFGRYQVKCFEKLINYLYVFVEWFPLYLKFFIEYLVEVVPLFGELIF